MQKSSMGKRTDLGRLGFAFSLFRWFAIQGVISTFGLKWMSRGVIHSDFDVYVSGLLVWFLIQIGYLVVFVKKFIDTDVAWRLQEIFPHVPISRGTLRLVLILFSVPVTLVLVSAFLLLMGEVRQKSIKPIDLKNFDFQEKRKLNHWLESLIRSGGLFVPVFVLGLSGWTYLNLSFPNSPLASLNLGVTNPLAYALIRQSAEIGSLRQLQKDLQSNTQNSSTDIYLKLSSEPTLGSLGLSAMSVVSLRSVNQRISNIKESQNPQPVFKAILIDFITLLEKRDKSLYFSEFFPTSYISPGGTLEVAVWTLISTYADAKVLGVLVSSTESLLIQAKNSRDAVKKDIYELESRLMSTRSYRDYQSLQASRIYPEIQKGLSRLGIGLAK